MFGELIIWYLFFGGVAGGACLAYACVNAMARRRAGSWRTLADAVSAPLLAVSAAALAAGVVCLVKDLPVPSRSLLLLANPTASPLSVGAFSLMALAACVAGLAALRIRPPKRHGWAVRALEAATALIALVVVFYTGWFLFRMRTVPFWSSPLLPVLFTLSALSCGVACALMAVAACLPRNVARMESAAVLLRADAAILALEVLAAAGIFVQLHGNALAAASFQELATGTLQPTFWLGFAGVGLALPLAMEVSRRGAPPRGAAWCIIISVSVLIGALCLRECVVAACVHPSLFMLTGI